MPDDPSLYVKPSVTVDIVVFTVSDTDLKVLLIRRAGETFHDHWAIAGGFVECGDGSAEDQGEDVDKAAERELEEETNLAGVFLEQLYTFGRADRDPRGRVISVAYYALIPPGEMRYVDAGSDAAEATWFSVHHEVDDLELAFDHRHILNVAVDRIQGKLDYTPLAFELVPKAFTVSELRAVYEAIKGGTYDGRNFHRRFKRMQEDGIIDLAPGRRSTPTRSARVYRFNRKLDPTYFL